MVPKFSRMPQAPEVAMANAWPVFSSFSSKAFAEAAADAIVPIIPVPCHPAGSSGPNDLTAVSRVRIRLLVPMILAD
jgi:hypothetical protein